MLFATSCWREEIAFHGAAVVGQIFGRNALHTTGLRNVTHEYFERVGWNMDKDAPVISSRWRWCVHTAHSLDWDCVPGNV